MDFPLFLQALIFGLFSALSLPVGAVLGLYLETVPARTTSRWMAFGSGALVFAVATQLYGEALFRLLYQADLGKRTGDGCSQVCQTRFKNINLQNIMGLVGAMLYLMLNRWLERVAHASRARVVELDPVSPTVDVEGVAGLQQLPAFIPLDAMGRTPSGTSMARTLSNTLVRSERRSFIRPWCSNHFEVMVAVSPVGSESHGDALVSEAGDNVAMSMWLGLLLDGIPESLMLGFMTNEKTISFTFLAAIFVANFPEAFSGASILKAQGMPARKVFLMWFIVFVLTGVLAMVGSLIMPVGGGSVQEKVRDSTTAIAEGLTGGAMLAMIATAMLPEAFKGAKEEAGVLFVLGFVLSVFITGLGARFGEAQA